MGSVCMSVLISSEPFTTIEIGASGVREIYQNVQTILATTKGTVFLDRHFGVDGTLIDQPTPAAIARYRSHVITEIEKQETRVKVTAVEFQQTTNEAGEGVLRPRVRITIKEGVLL